MLRRIGVLVVVGAVFILASWQVPPAYAQVFPYMAPQAPEFDNQGRAIDRKPTRNHYPENQSSVIAPPKSSWEQGDHSTKRTQPQVGPRFDPARRAAPPAPEFGSRADRVPYAPPPPAQAAPVATAPGPPPPAAVQPRLDCSQFPMLIAQARSEAEMRQQAIQYLTCLVRNGWDQAAAKNHVISVIESAYRATR
jgi:hypothetical protein